MIVALFLLTIKTTPGSAVSLEIAAPFAKFRDSSTQQLGSAADITPLVM
jgi:hypothetical protein